MSVGFNQYTALGGSSYGSLSDDDFDLLGTTYTIETLTIAVVPNNNLQIKFSSAPADQAQYLTLHLGSASFLLTDATLSSDNVTFIWSSHGLSWSDNDMISVSLTDSSPPEVSSVALTSTHTADAYGINELVQATVTFDAAVDITGTPQLELDFDGTAKAAACTAATNTTTMVCEYKVVVGDSAPNGVAVAANTLTGGTITATGSTTITADLDHDAVMIDAGHKVDGIRPTLVTTGPDAPTTSTDGTQVILTFNETLLSAVLRTNITIEANGVTATTTAASVTGTEVELTLTTALTASATNLTVALATFAVQDTAGNPNLSLAATGVTNAIVPEPPGRPAAPSVSSVAGSTTSLSVTWTAPANTGPAIDDYDLQYRQGTSGNFTAGPQDQTGTSATITGLTANTLYQVQVRATNTDGDGPWSPSGSGQTNTAGNTAPTFSSSTATRSVAENSPAGTDVGAAVTATDGDNDPLAYSLDGSDAASFTIVATSGQIRTRSGVTYDYETKSSYMVIVKANDNNGGTDTVTVTIELTNDVNEPPLAPAAPTVTATPNTTDSLTVSWSAPSNTGRPAIDDYDLQYREGTTGNWTPGPQNVSGTSATITGLTAARTAYQVQVRATNADGAGDWSTSGRIRTTPPPPPDPEPDPDPTPTPTLPALAAWVLAVLLVGRGASLLRGRRPLPDRTHGRRRRT